MARDHRASSGASGRGARQGQIGSRPHVARARTADTLGDAREVALRDGVSSPRPKLGPARRPASIAGGPNLRDRFPPSKEIAVLIPWLALGAFVLIALAVDIVAGSSGPPSVRRALVWSVIWTVVGAGFAGVLLFLDGRTAAEEYLAGFLVEKSLSLDNLFVFAVLFSFLAVPAEQRRRVLLYGIGGRDRAARPVHPRRRRGARHVPRRDLRARRAARLHRGEDRPPRRRAGRPGEDVRDARRCGASRRPRPPPRPRS